MYPSHVFVYSLLVSLKHKIYYVYFCLYFDVLFNNSFHSVTYNLFSQRYTLCFKYVKCKIMSRFKIQLKQLQRPLYSGNMSVQHFCNTEIIWTALCNLKLKDTARFLASYKVLILRNVLSDICNIYILLPIFFTYCK
jgi:hypothetical protein